MLAIMLPCFGSPLHGQNKPQQTYRAGGLSFVIPTPGDLSETGPDYRVLLEPYAPNANRLIAAFLTLDDLQVLHTGKVPLSSQYAFVQVPRSAEFVDVDDQAFKQLLDGFDQQFAANVDANLKDGEEELNQRLKALTGKQQDIKLDAPVKLGRFFTKPDADAYGMIMPVSGNGITLQRAMSLCIMNVNHRIVFTYLYMDYKNEDTIKQLRASMEQWTDAILKSNQ